MTLLENSRVVMRANPREADIGWEFERLYPGVFKYFRLRGADVDTANDLTSMVFERAITYMHTYDPAKASLSTWLFTIARNTAINHWKHQQRQIETGLDGVEERSFGSPLPEDLVIRQESREELLAAINKLDERERDLVALKFSTGLNNRQIAGMTGLSESNVGVILHRALTRVRAEVGRE